MDNDLAGPFCYEYSWYGQTWKKTVYHDALLHYGERPITPDFDPFND